MLIRLILKKNDSKKNHLNLLKKQLQILNKLSVKILNLYGLSKESLFQNMENLVMVSLMMV